jgi:CDP-diacylglycerol--glycerol-3-phosphate 3-phosphatidyltransferase
MIPSQLRHQAWLAAMLLFSPWLLTTALHLSLLRQRPLAFFTLLPGLAAAVHVLLQLSRHLGDNHRLGEQDRLFPTLGAASWITVLRAAAIVLLAGFLPVTISPGYELPKALNWAPGLVYLGIALADLLDGLLARRLQRETELGKCLDIASDAAGLLVASLVAVSLGRLPAIYLLVGLAYYPFIFGMWWRRKQGLPLVALPPRPYARIIAGFQMGLVGVALLPLLHPSFSFVAAYIFMIPLLLGFLRDWLVVSCRITSDTAVERRIGALLTRGFPLALRFIILVSGLAMLTAGDDYLTSLPRQLALGFCCLLAGCAVMGRSASLFLTLLLGSNLSPIGISMPAMVLFAAAATMMLTGTGTLSLWAPEETILYRRHGKKMAVGGASP